jgi:hypothetical protein
MSYQPSSRAAEIAAQHVESIVAAAEAAADEVRRQAEEQAEAIRAEGRREAEAELERARAEALKLGQDARREAENMRTDAQKESDQIREQTRRAVEGRVDLAEERAAAVMKEAETLSTGLRRLGDALSEQGGRILRDVEAAHRRMQADLQVSAGDEREPSRRPRAARTPSDGGRERAGRTNPLEDFEVPRWVGRDR